MLKYKPTVFIIEDDIAVCEILELLFNSVNLGTEIYNNGFDYLKVYNPSRVGCLLIDIRLPGMSGLELQQELIIRKNPIPIIIMTGHGDVTLAVRTLKAGAKDFILKPFNNEILIEEIQKAIRENLEHHRHIIPFLECMGSLTPREKQVMELIIKGKLNKKIATKLNISLSTVEKHRANIMQKTKSLSSIELVAKYFSLNPPSVRGDGESE